MIGFSPKGVLEAVTIFPAMLVIALVLDIIGLILLCFGLDDFFILDIIGLVIFGIWIGIRSGGERTVTAPPTLKEKRVAIKKVVKLGKRLGRVGLRVGICFLLEAITWVGGILFCWTALVVFEFISDLRSFSLEAGE